MLRYLKGEPGELRDTIDKIDKREKDIEDCLGIVCRKEREMKKKGRLFVGLTEQDWLKHHLNLI